MKRRKKGRRRKSGLKAKAYKRRRKNPSVPRRTRRRSRVVRKAYKRRRHRNPSGGAVGLLKIIGGAVIGNIAAKAAGNYGAGMLAGMLPESVQPYAKPGIQGALVAGLYFFGDKIIKDSDLRTGIIAGAGAEAVNGILQAVLPENIKGMLADVTGEMAPVSLADITYTPLSDGASKYLLAGLGGPAKSDVGAGGGGIGPALETAPDGLSGDFDSAW